MSRRAALRRTPGIVFAVFAVLLLVAHGVATADDDDDNRKPTACFSQSPTSPTSGETVTFTSCSSDRDGWVRLHAWDLDNDGAFDDGSGTTASRSFATPGHHTVRLRVVDNGGASATTSRTVSVANRPPVASFGSSPAEPLSGESVTFTSSSSDPDGSIASQSWDLDNDGDFDDGSSPTVSRSFALPGDYTVRLRVVDNRGASATTSRTVSVANRAPVAAFGFGPDAPLSGETVTFDSSSSDPDGSIASQSWDLDNDGDFDDASGPTASRAFAAPGVHTVRLRVVDDLGAEATMTGTVTVGNRPPVAAFSYGPESPQTTDEVTFNSSSSDPDGSIASLSWDLDNDSDFDDGVGPTAARAFATPGDHTVRLRVVDDRGSAATTAVSVRVGERQSGQAAPDETFDQSTPVDDTPVDETIPWPEPIPIEPLHWLDPFPVVRIRGRTTPQGARVSLFTVTAPPGALVRLRCSGRSCPLSNVTRTARSTGRRSGGLLRFRRIERHLRAGVVLTVFVTSDGLVGKYTRITIRRLVPPRRRDRCLMPGSLRPRTCPQRQ